MDSKAVSADALAFSLLPRQVEGKPQFTEKSTDRPLSLIAAPPGSQTGVPKSALAAHLHRVYVPRAGIAPPLFFRPAGLPGELGSLATACLERTGGGRRGEPLVISASLVGRSWIQGRDPPPPPRQVEACAHPPPPAPPSSCAQPSRAWNALSGASRGVSDSVLPPLNCKSGQGSSSERSARTVSCLLRGAPQASIPPSLLRFSSWAHISPGVTGEAGSPGPREGWTPKAGMLPWGVSFMPP